MTCAKYHQAQLIPAGGSSRDSLTQIQVWLNCAMLYGVETDWCSNSAGYETIVAEGLDAQLPLQNEAPYVAS